jgi:hypothetical protein
MDPLSVLTNTGIDPSGELVTGKLTRATCACKPTKKGRDGNGWYLYHADEPATLTWGCWNTECQNNAGGTVTSKRESELTQADREKIKARIEADRKVRELERQQVEHATREKAARLWQSGHDVAADHDYIKRKGITPKGIKQVKDMLLIPMTATGTGEPESLQLIFLDSSKKFLTGTGAVPGPLYHVIKGGGGPLYIVEGYATGCSVHHATLASVAVAFSAGKLPAVAQALRGRFQDREIVIAGDTGNGSSKATEAARLIGGKLVLPTLSAGTDFNDLAQSAGLEEVARQLATAEFFSPDPIQEQGAEKEKQPQALFVGGASLLDDQPSINWLVKGMIEADSIGQLFGPSGGGKSFVALDLSLSIATGTRWNDRETLQGVVLYLAGEGRTGLKRRVKAWHVTNRNNVISAFNMSRHTVPIDDTAVNRITEAGRQIEAGTGHSVKLVVVDTLARHLVGDENSTREMGAFITACETIRGNFPGCTLLIVHHTGNSEEAKTRSRGSSALKAAMDFELHCDKGALTCTKMKDADEPAPVLFKLRPVQIGTDENGEPVTSCVPEYGERSQRHKQAELTGTEKELLKVIGEHPGELIGDIRRLFYDRRRVIDPEVKATTLKKAFSRAFEGLTAKGFAQLHGDTVTGGQATNGGQMGDMSPEGVRGTGGQQLYNSCPFVSPPCPSPSSVPDEIPDFDLEVQL